MTSGACKLTALAQLVRCPLPTPPLLGLIKSGRGCWYCRLPVDPAHRTEYHRPTPPNACLPLLAFSCTWHKLWWNLNTNLRTWKIGQIMRRQVWNKIVLCVVEIIGGWDEVLNVHYQTATGSSGTSVKWETTTTNATLPLGFRKYLGFSWEELFIVSCNSRALGIVSSSASHHRMH